MPEAIFPDDSPTKRTLPFLYVAQIQALDGDVIEPEVPVSIWPTTGFNAGVARAYDHQGEAPLEFHAPLTVANRRLVLETVAYAIVEAVPHQFVPHVALRLRRMDSGG